MFVRLINKFTRKY